MAKAIVEKFFSIRWQAAGISAGLLAIGFGAWLFFKKPPTCEADLPLIRPQEGPTRVRPVPQEAGPHVPDQDKKIYSHLEKAKQAPKVEELLPPEEEPLVETTVVEEKAPSAPPPPAPSLAAPPVSIDQILAQVSGPPPQEQEKISFQKNGKYRLQLGSLPTQDLAEKEWRRIASLASQIFPTDLKPQFDRVDLGRDQGVIYRIVVAGLSTKKQAQDFCQQLKKKRIDCVVILP